MAATIQEIELPKLARARDTSSSLQPIGPNLLAGSDFTGITQAESTSGAVWVTGEGWTIGSGVASCDGSQSAVSYLYNDDVDLASPEGKHWEMTYTITAISAGSVQLMVGGYGPNTTAQTTTGTYTEIVGPINPSSVQRAYVKATADFVGSIDNVIVKQAINFNNNNHGQIYSGRALEFDGVADNLTTGSDIEGVNKFSDGTAWTVTLWVYFTGDASEWYTGEDGGSYSMLIKESDESLRFREVTGGAFHNFNSTNPINLNTWYRQTVVCNGTTLTCYLNGEIWGSAITPDSTLMYFTNIGMPYETGGVRSKALSGMISDFQVWDAAFTQADVTYDYLNPEQTAISGGGTALTESNLKLWYPMQDGHRGQQSYILDGANSGLGPELVTNGDFTADSDWTFTNSTTTRIEGNKAVVTSNGSNAYVRQSISGTAGDLVKVSFKYSDKVSSGLAYVRIDGTDIQSSGSWQEGTVTVYYKLVSSGNLYLQFMTYGTEGASFTLEDVSVKAINDKHHATTVFHGDELIDNNTFTAVSDWNLIQATYTVGSNIANVVNTATIGGINQVFTTVVGRTYKLTFTAADGDVDATIQLGYAAEAGQYYQNVGFTGTAEVSFVAVGTSTVLSLRVNSSVIGANCNFSNISVKEVGVASGWTDADQQLHIPQTALQSYNELAWFDGYNDLVSIGDDNSLDVTSITVSAWVNTAVTGAEKAAVAKSYGTAFEFGINSNSQPHLNCKINGVYNSHLHNTGTALAVNTWNHVVWTYDRSSNSSKTYLNGVLNETVTPNAGDGAGLGINADSLLIGGRSASALQWNGSITEVGIWSSAITSDEVQAVFNDGKALDVSSDSGSYASSGDLVSYWRNNGLSSWTDLKGSNNGTPTNITETILIPQGIDSSRDSQGFIMNKEKDTSSLNLTNGSDNPHVDLGSTTTIAADGTASFVVWLKPDDVIGNYFMGKGASQDSIKINSATSLRFRANNVDDTFTVGTIIPGDWIHVAVVKAGSGADEMTVYINGTASTDTETSIGAFDYRYIGAERDSIKSFRGAIDGFLIYESALSQPEVERNYKATKGSHRN